MFPVMGMFSRRTGVRMQHVRRGGNDSGGGVMTRISYRRRQACGSLQSRIARQYGLGWLDVSSPEFRSASIPGRHSAGTVEKEQQGIVRWYATR